MCIDLRSNFFIHLVTQEYNLLSVLVWLYNITHLVSDVSADGCTREFPCVALIPSQRPCGKVCPSRSHQHVERADLGAVHMIPEAQAPRLGCAERLAQ